MHHPPFPPSFWDLPKNMDDLITSGYFRDVLRLDVKTRTRTGVKFRFGGEETLRDRDVVGFLEAQYEFKEYGVTFLENWNTDNVLTTTLSIDEYIAGLMWTLETSLYPDKWPRDDPSLSNPAAVREHRKWSYGDKTLRLETLYRNNFGSLNLETVLGASQVQKVEIGPVFKGGVVCNLYGLMVGCGIGLDVGAISMLDCVMGAHFETDSMILNAFMTNAKIFSTAWIQKFSEGDIQSGVTARWSIDDPEIKEFRFACRCNLEEDTTLYFKLDNLKYFGVGISQRIRKGVKFLVSFVANGMHLLNGNLYEDYHFGACLELGDDL